MINNLVYTLPILSMLSGALAAYIPIRLGIRKLPKAVDLMITEVEAEALLEEELDALIRAFQQEIPMAATFLKGALLEKLRVRSKEKLIGIFPKIKSRVQQKIALLVVPRLRVEVMQATFFGAFIGFIFGFLFIAICL